MSDENPWRELPEFQDGRRLMAFRLLDALCAAVAKQTREQTLFEVCGCKRAGPSWHEAFGHRHDCPTHLLAEAQEGQP